MSQPEAWADCSSSIPCADVQSVVLPSGQTWVELLHDATLCIVVNASVAVSPPPPLAPPAPPPHAPSPIDAGPQPGFAVVFFLLGCLVGSLTCGIALAVSVTGRWSVRPPKGHREAAASQRRRDEVRAAKAKGAGAGALADVGRQQTLSHEEIARRSLEEAKLAGEVSEHILRRAPAAAPVAAPADDCIPEEQRLSFSENPLAA